MAASEIQINHLARAREKRKQLADARKLAEGDAPSVEEFLPEMDLSTKTKKVTASENIDHLKTSLHDMVAWREFFCAAVVSCQIDHPTRLQKAEVLANAMLEAYTTKSEEKKK
jgi:Rps23 Pro-64 3,4-dihydroxylase Tpa1-like proline 4-hydroxylase